jgi:hypothetical protein
MVDCHDVVIVLEELCEHLLSSLGHLSSNNNVKECLSNVIS